MSLYTTLTNAFNQLNENDKIEETNFNLIVQLERATLYDDTTPLLSIGIDGYLLYTNPRREGPYYDTTLLDDTLERLACRLGLNDNQVKLLKEARQEVLDELYPKQFQTIDDVIPKAPSVFDQALSGKVNKLANHEEPYIEGYDLVSDLFGYVGYMAEQKSAVYLMSLAYRLIPKRVLGKNIYIVKIADGYYMKVFDRNGVSFGSALRLFSVTKSGISIREGLIETTYTCADDILTSYNITDDEDCNFVTNTFNKLMGLVK